MIDRRRFLSLAVASVAAAPLALLLPAPKVQAAVETEAPSKPKLISSPRSTYGEFGGIYVAIDQPSPSKADPMGMWGFVSFKTKCESCSRQWGDWQKFGDEAIEKGFWVPSPSEAAYRAHAYLKEQGFRVVVEDNFTRYSVTCPSCLDEPDRSSIVLPLIEGVVPLNYTWYLGAWVSSVSGKFVLYNIDLYGQVSESPYHREA